MHMRMLDYSHAIILIFAYYYLKTALQSDIILALFTYKVR